MCLCLQMACQVPEGRGRVLFIFHAKHSVWHIAGLQEMWRELSTPRPSLIYYHRKLGRLRHTGEEGLKSEHKCTPPQTDLKGTMWKGLLTGG